jgi:hypothetical protein
MRTTTGSVQSNPPKPNPPAYPPPSVPMSIYRELADELHTAEAKLDVLNAKNQQLAQENQTLRQEITRVVQACLQLQKLVDPQAVPAKPATSGTSSDRPVPRSANNVKNTTKDPIAADPSRHKVSRPQPPIEPQASGSKNYQPEFFVPVVEMISSIPEPIFIEEQEVSYYPPTEPKSKEISGWWLVITILLIMLTAFGAGYLVVRPLFERHSR